jgi:signal transduction histidine kinase
MKLSLYQRLSLSLFLVFIVIAAVFYFWSQQIEQNTRFESEQRLHLSLAANLASDNPLLQQGVFDHQALKNLFHSLMILGPAFEFYYLSPSGKILTYSADSSQVKRKTIDTLPILQLIRNQAPLPIYGDDPRSRHRKKIFSAAPVFKGQNLQGYLYVIVTGEQYDDAFAQLQSNKVIELTLVLFAGGIIFLFVLLLGLFRYFTAPLRQLSRDMTRFKDAGFDKNKVQLKAWQQNSDNEVHQLGNVFAQMVEQINSQLVRLQQADIHRRELLAHISHDLRTPLASLQGYIETVALKADTLAEHEQQQFIDTALKNSCQLKKLIDQIFELAHLEDGQVSLNLETFNLAELLWDVVAKFSLQAQHKKISLKVLPEASHIQVYSDIGKIERVLSNLIENALRHTPENGEIAIAIKEHSNAKDNQCLISVKDNGTGIKAEEVAYIFDARYRASNAIQSKGQHTGLGLAITKRLLELLQSEISVKSELGQGTTFAFNVRKVVIN